MNRQIEITLDGGGSLHVPSQNIVYMTPEIGGVYGFGYMSGKRLIRRSVTTAPSVLETEVSYLAEIVNDRFSLINSNHIIGTLDKGSSHDLKYQIPGGRLIDLGVTMTLTSLHSEMTKSIRNTALNSITSQITSATSAINANASNISGLATSLNNTNSNLASLADGVVGPKKDK